MILLLYKIDLGRSGEKGEVEDRRWKGLESLCRCACVSVSVFVGVCREGKYVHVGLLVHKL